MTAQVQNVTCPMRKVTLGEPDTPPYELIERDGRPVLVVRSFDLARSILRIPDGVRQAGFMADLILAMKHVKAPVVYQEGTEHRDQRRATARYFTPKVVQERYRERIEELAADVVDAIREQGEVDLDPLIFTMVTRGAAQALGLTNSDGAAMARRLEAFFAIDVGERPTRAKSALVMAKSQVSLLNFYRRDVRPAIAARRQVRQDDVISSLLDKGLRDRDILIECVTYAAAGMISTREYLTLVVWHFLEQPDLRERYLAADLAQRYRMLSELLRLEPVVGALRRRTDEPLTLQYGDLAVQLPADTLIDIQARPTNADTSVFGPDTDHAHWDRDLAPGIDGAGIGFGAGRHECPGQYLALVECDVLLRTLFAQNVELVRAPEVSWNMVIVGYQLRGLRVRIR